MGAKSLVYLATDPDRAQGTIDALEERGLDVVAGELARGREIVEQVQPHGVVVDFEGDPDTALVLTAWIRSTSPHRDHPCFAAGVPPEHRDTVEAKASGTRVVEGSVPEAVADVFKGQIGFMVRDQSRGATQDDDIMIV